MADGGEFGPPYFVTQRLILTVADRWSVFDGWLASRGIDPFDLPADRFLSIAYHWLTKDGEPAEVKKFDARLWIPPKGVTPTSESPWSAEAETSAFKSLKSALNVKDPKPSPTPTPKR